MPLAHANTYSYGETSELKTELSPSDKEKYSLRLVKKVFQWAREVNPSQPLTMGIWRGNTDHWCTPGKLPAVDRVMIENSDVITFHTYDNNIKGVQSKIDQSKKYGRSIIFTEYMARTNNNLFQDVMPLFKEENVGAITWGFVSGKTNTIYPWESWDKTFTGEPEIWFHDILRKDGEPYSKEEAALIKSLTKN